MYDIVDYSKIERYHDGYPGEFIPLEKIKPGLHFYFLDGPDKNLKDWYEVVEIEWDWRYQSWNIIAWNNETEKFSCIRKIDVYTYGRVD